MANSRTPPLKPTFQSPAAIVAPALRGTAPSTAAIRNFAADSAGGPNAANKNSIAGLGGQQTGVQVGGVTTTLPNVANGYVVGAGDTFGGDSGGGGGGGGGGASASDWFTAFFNQYNLPSDVQAQIVSLLTQYAANPQVGVALAQQYLRTTAWWQATFPGFNEGVAAGLFTDETGYRSYLNQVNQAYNNYLGRHVSGDELKAYLAQGLDPGTVGKQLQGDAYVNANRNEIQYLAGNFGEPGSGQLSDKDLQSYGREQVGLDTASGQKLQAALGRAQQRLTAIFGGTDAKSGLSLGANGVSAPGLSGTRQATDVQA